MDMEKLLQHLLDNEEVKLDIDVFIKMYNDKNPTLKSMDRKTMKRILHSHSQTFVVWKHKKTPLLIYKIRVLLKILDCTFEELLTKVPKE